MNKVLIIGNLAKDPELKWINKDNCVVKFQIATNERWLDKDGNKMERADFHNCSAWGKRAEIISKFVKKGDKLAVQGKIRNNNFETKEGAKVYGYEIIVEEFEFCNGKKNESSNDSSNQSSESFEQQPNSPPSNNNSSNSKSKTQVKNDDDIPF